MTRWSGTHSFIRSSDSVSRETVAPLDTSGATVVFGHHPTAIVDMKDPVSSLNDASATAARLWFHVKPGVSLRQSSFPPVNTFPIVEARQDSNGVGADPHPGV